MIICYAYALFVIFRLYIYKIQTCIHTKKSTFRSNGKISYSNNHQFVLFVGRKRSPKFKNQNTDKHENKNRNKF